MNQSFTSNASACSQVSAASLKSLHYQAPPELLGFIYDIPRGVTRSQIQSALDSFGFECQVQVKPFPAQNEKNQKRPYTQGLVKFQSAAQLRVATEKLRFFTLPAESSNNQSTSTSTNNQSTSTKHQMRFMPFDPQLYRGKLPLAFMSDPTKKEFSTSSSQIDKTQAMKMREGLNLSMSFPSIAANQSQQSFSEQSISYDPSSTSLLIEEQASDKISNASLMELQCLPDNSQAQVNLCVTGLDSSLMSEDLYQMFERFGKIKSCKVASDPVTSESRNYGYVLFHNEKSCTKALESKDLPYPVQLYQAFCTRQVEKMTIDSMSQDQMQQQANSNSNSNFLKSCSVILSGFPASMQSKDLAALIGSEFIEEITMYKSAAKIQFKDLHSASSCLILDGISISGNRLTVKPLSQNTALSATEKANLLNKASSDAPKNMYITHIPKELSEIEVRRKLAIYGKISSFKLINSTNFTTNIAYAAYLNGDHAQKLFKEQPFGKIYFHIQKQKTRQEQTSGVLFDISNQLNQLSQLDLLASKDQDAEDSDNKENDFFKSQLQKAQPGNNQKIEETDLSALNSLFDKLKVGNAALNREEDDDDEEEGYGQKNQQSDKLSFEELTRMKEAYDKSLTNQISSQIPPELLAFPKQ